MSGIRAFGGLISLLDTDSRRPGMFSVSAFMSMRECQLSAIGLARSIVMESTAGTNGVTTVIEFRIPRYSFGGRSRLELRAHFVSTLRFRAIAATGIKYLETRTQRVLRPLHDPGVLYSRRSEISAVV